MYEYRKENVVLSKNLRKNMTKEEKKIWYDFLKKIPFTVHRQKTIGNYILDFYIANKKVAIEIDGIQHQTEEAKKADIQRDKDFENIGITVLRYSNKDVNSNFNAVCEDILKNLNLKAKDLK